MASRYPHDIPAYAGAGHSGYYNFPPSGALPTMMPAPRTSPAYTHSKPIPIPQTPKQHKTKRVMTDSYADHTMKKFADHAYNCASCYDPMTIHMEGGQLCHRGHKLARKVAKALYETAEEKYRVSNPSSRRLDGKAMIEVSIPRGCEVVRSLLKAMECGLKVRSSSDAVAATPVRSHFEDYPASDEQLYRSRPSHREQGSRARSRSAKRGTSTGPSNRRLLQQPVGVHERERRPYGASHSSNGSVDSGYDTAPGSPDVRRGSQYAEDMKRRQERPKSILKKTLSFEREHLLENEPSTPRSPKEKYVVFNIRGECLAPGFP